MTMKPSSALDYLIHSQSADNSDFKEAMLCAISALKKQIPKKPRVDSESWLCCPNCNETFAMFDMLNRRLLCCGCCGQKLDWSEVDAKKRSDTE